MKRLLTLLLLLAPSVLAQNPVSGGPIPQTTYNTPPVLANPTHGTGAPTGTCMSGVLYTNDSNGNLYACNNGTWGSASGAGSVTHTGNLTLNSMLLGNGVADVKIDTACVTNGTGALSGCTSISAGAGASSAGATAMGGIAVVEATSTGWTPTAGQAYLRGSSLLDNFAVSIPLNGATETPLPVFSAVPAGSKCLQSNGVAGLITETGGACGTSSWSSLLAPSGNLSLSMGANTSEFDYTSALASAFNWANTTAATASVNQSSPILNLCGQGWEGGGPANLQDCVTIQNKIPNGANPVSEVDFVHTGSNSNAFMLYRFDGYIYTAPSKALFLGTTFGSGNVETYLSNLGLSLNSASPIKWSNNATYANGGSLDTGLSRIGAGLVGVGNGQLGDLTGRIKAAGFTCPQAADIGAQAVNSATYMCPAAVTAWRAAVPAAAPAGIILNSNVAGLVTQSTSGDSNHSVHVTAQTGTKTIYTLCPASAGGCNVAGQYRITWYFNQGGTACGTPTPGQVTFEISWTDNAGAHTTVALPMNDNSSIAVFTSAFKFAASNTTGFASGEFNLWSTGAQPIQVTNSYTACGVGTGTWELTAAVEQVQ